MEPRIQYAKTSDGVSIAFAIVGSGPPIMYGRRMMSPSIDYEADRVLQSFSDILTRHSMVIWDSRNFGLSDTSTAPIDLETFLLDMEAVVGELPTSTVDVLGFLSSCHVALAYASRHPEGVRKVGLWNPWTGAVRDVFGSALDELRRADFAAWADLMSLRLLGWDQAQQAQRMAEALKRSWTAESYEQFLNVVGDLDATTIAQHVRARVLILFERNFGVGVIASGLIGERDVSVVERSARTLAAAIPHAELTIAEDATAGPAIFHTFFDADKHRAAGDPSSQPSVAHGTVIILFADIADSTALTERLGDAPFREKARGLDGALRKAIATAGGTAIDGKVLGDGVLATFGAAREAIACAQACHAAGSHAGLPLHIGIHAGDVIREEGNVYGGAVNIASRVASEAPAGETLVSGTVRELARTSAGVAFEDRGERELKGVGELVRVWAVRWREDG